MRIPIRPLVLSVCAMNCVEREYDAGGTTGPGSTTAVESTSAVEGTGDTEDTGTSGTSSGGPEDVEPIEACDEEWARRYCTTDEGTDGVQFCGLIAGEMRWGPCAHIIACWPGDRRDCQPDDAYYEDCVLDDEGLPEWVEGESCPFTPLVLRFDDARLELSPARSHAFDISGTGACLTSDWPGPATPWLALDRDGDGAIADARELFGSGVVLRTGSRAPDGFVALAEHDRDGDGRITPRDPVWLDLLLWSDHDGDRRSSPWELAPVAAHGLTAIDLDARLDRRCDARGNCELEHAGFTWLRPDGTLTTGDVVDVHLACQ